MAPCSVICSFLLAASQASFSTGNAGTSFLAPNVSRYCQNNREKKDAARAKGRHNVSSSSDDSDGGGSPGLRGSEAEDPFFQQDDDPFADPFFQVRHVSNTLTSPVATASEEVGCLPQARSWSCCEQPSVCYQHVSCL